MSPFNKGCVKSYLEKSFKNYVFLFKNGLFTGLVGDPGESRDIYG